MCNERELILEFLSEEGAEYIRITDFDEYSFRYMNASFIWRAMTLEEFSEKWIAMLQSRGL